MMSSSPVNQFGAQRWLVAVFTRLPNSITVFRLLLAPVLLWLAWHAYPKSFLALLAFAFFSDVVDGFIARRYHLESRLGARLDTVADAVIYATIPVAAWWLWPEIIREEALYVVAVIVSYTLPPLIGLIKFGVMPSYHTSGVKLAVALMGCSVIWLFAGGPAWPFRIAAIMCVLAAAEEIAITLVSPKEQLNVPSFWHALKRQHR